MIEKINNELNEDRIEKAPKNALKEEFLLKTIQSDVSGRESYLINNLIIDYNNIYVNKFIFSQKLSSKNARKLDNVIFDFFQKDARKIRKIIKKSEKIKKIKGNIKGGLKWGIVFFLLFLSAVSALLWSAGLDLFATI